MVLPECRRFFRTFTLFILILLGAPGPGVREARAAGISAADEGPVTIRIFKWPKWQKGFELGVKFDGKFGRGDTIDAPPGDIILQPSFHIWYEHLVDLHALFGFGFNNGTFIFGVGSKVNILELIDDSYGEFRNRGLQRGLLSAVIKNFMLFGGVDFLHLGFRTPDPALGLTYPSGIWAFMPNLGAQWYFYVQNGFASRFYLETSIEYTRVNTSNYILPFVGIGCELN